MCIAKSSMTTIAVEAGSLKGLGIGWVGIRVWRRASQGGGAFDGGSIVERGGRHDGGRGEL